MFGPHLSNPHDAAGLQFGAPSVARMTNVLPGSFCKMGSAAAREELVGVPPAGAAPVRKSRLVVVGPSVVEDGGSQLC
jgi:hypothetical protein